MTTFYRFQKTKNLEKESYSEFLSDIYFTIGDEENEWALLDNEEKEELISEISEKWSFALDMWWDKHREKFNDKELEDEYEFLIDLLSGLDEDGLLNFMMEHKLNGVFALQLSEFPDKEELIKLSKKPELGLHNDYLLTLKGNEIAYFGPEYGYLIEPLEIIQIEEVPESFRK